jgi:hypothetical protein
MRFAAPDGHPVLHAEKKGGCAVHADEPDSPHDSHRTDTPLYDAMVHALSAHESVSSPGSAGGELSGDTAQATAGESSIQDSVNPVQADPPMPRYVIDPDTPEGTAIFQLFRRLHDIVQGGVDWPGADVVMALTLWFAEDLGIDPAEPPLVAENRLRMALCGPADGRPSTTVYRVRIGTNHAAPKPIVRAALRDLARRLGPGTGIGLVTANANANDGDGDGDRGRGLVVRIEQHPFPDPGC